MQNEKDLGRDIFVAAFTLKGGRCPACPGKIARLTQKVIEAIEMDTAGLEPAVWFYPTGDGRGGAWIYVRSADYDVFSDLGRVAGSRRGLLADNELQDLQYIARSVDRRLALPCDRCSRSRHEPRG